MHTWQAELHLCRPLVVFAAWPALQRHAVTNLTFLCQVEFYTPTCSACIAFASEYAKVATSLQVRAHIHGLAMGAFYAQGYCVHFSCIADGVPMQ